MTSEKVELLPILQGDREGVAQFLHENLNTSIPVGRWTGLLTPPWSSLAPNHGYRLVTQDRIVGAYVAVYSQRDLGGASLQFCNLAAFCVLDDYRAHSLRLLRAILGQKGYQFTDLSPSGNVVALNERLGFIRLDSTTKVSANLPALPRRGITVSADPAVIAATLTGDDAVIFRDHRDAAAARHVIVTAHGEYAYLVFRKDRRKRAPVFATPLYVGGSRRLLQSAWNQIASHLLIKHGLAATLGEQRVLGFLPSRGVALASPRAKMFRSKTLDAGQIDYLYSELALLEW